MGIMCLKQAVRNEARERVRRMEGREISQVTGKGDLLQGFPQGDSPCKSFLWLLCGKQAEGSQTRRQRPEGVVQLGDERCLEIITRPGSGLVRGMQRKDTNTGVHLGWEYRGDRMNNSREGATSGPCRM